MINMSVKNVYLFIFEWSLNIYIQMYFFVKIVLTIYVFNSLLNYYNTDLFTWSIITTCLYIIYTHTVKNEMRWHKLLEFISMYKRGSRGQVEPFNNIDVVENVNFNIDVRTQNWLRSANGV